MKNILFTLLMSSSALFAEMKIPRSVFSSDQIKEATALAAEKDKALAFIYSDPGTT